jgi:osmotically-inducible protein OsmY
MNKLVRTIILLTLTAAPSVALLSTGCAGRHYNTTSAYVDDKGLSARVKTQLARDPIARATDINVTTFNREVQLSGFVATEEEKTRAAQIAASVPGVVSVHNNLIVRTGR